MWEGYRIALSMDTVDGHRMKVLKFFYSFGAMNEYKNQKRREKE